MSVANVKLLIDMIVTAMSSIRLLLPETAGTAAALHAAVLSSPLPAVFAERFDCLSSLVPKPVSYTHLDVYKRQHIYFEKAYIGDYGNIYDDNAKGDDHNKVQQDQHDHVCGDRENIELYFVQCFLDCTVSRYGGHSTAACHSTPCC